MNVYVLAMACMVGSNCQHGYFVLNNPMLVDCQSDILSMIEGHRIKDPNGNTIIWHAERCVEDKTPPKNRQMMGMF